MFPHPLRSRPAAIAAGAVLLGLHFHSAVAQKSPGGRSHTAPPSISYHVAAPDTVAETVRITGTLQGITGDTILFHFPVWAPGAYDIVNFGAYVSGFTATANGRPLEVIRGDTNTFRIVGPAPVVEIAYTVDDIEDIPNSSWFAVSDIESDLFFANATALFGYPGGYKDLATTVSYTVPEGWDIAIGLDPYPEVPAREGVHRFRARDYDELVDAPLAMGRFQRAEFSVGGKPHVVTMMIPERFGTADLGPLVDTTRRIVGFMSEFFGEMPYERYIFQHFLTDPRKGWGGGGALEHRNSSTYQTTYLRQDAIAQMLAPVIAHEYWHLWSPKRIHVSELGPFDYQRAPRTNSLWFAEGLTEYYAHLLMARNGMTTPRMFLGEFDRHMQEFYNRPQRHSIGELSTRITEVELHDIFDLYTKGPLIGLLLDAEIRSQTGNARSLDDAMRYFNNEYGRTGRTFGDEDIIPIMEQATGAKLAEFYRRYIVGVEPLPFDDLLPKIGLRYKGDSIADFTYAGRYEEAEEGVKVTAVEPGGTLAALGVVPGDIATHLILEGNRLKLSRLVLGGFGIEIPVIRGADGLVIQRNGREMELRGELVRRKVLVYTLEPDPDATPETLALRRGMLGF